MPNDSINKEGFQGVTSLIPENPNGITELVPTQEPKQSIAPEQRTRPALTQPLIDTVISPDKSADAPSKVESIASYTPENGKDNPAIAEKEFIDHIALDESSEKASLPNANQ